MEMILLKIIGDWVNKYKKTFWIYEVSHYYKPYKISISGLPDPAKENILINPRNRLLNDKQKTELCNMIKKACAKTKSDAISSIEVNIDFVKDAVSASIHNKNR